MRHSGFIAINEPFQRTSIARTNSCQPYGHKVLTPTDDSAGARCKHESAKAFDLKSKAGRVSKLIVDLLELAQAPSVADSPDFATRGSKGNWPVDMRFPHAPNATQKFAAFGCAVLSALPSRIYSIARLLGGSCTSALRNGNGRDSLLSLTSSTAYGVFAEHNIVRK